jgi:hypothetical protein
MPRLRVRRDGQYYLVSNLPNLGWCTDQLEPEAVEYLRTRGLAYDGACLALRDRSFLHERGWLYSMETGPTLDPLVRKLGSWVDSGHFDELDNALREGNYGNGQLHGCFTPAFLRWLSALDEPFGLADLAEMSWPDFSRLAACRIEQLHSDLHQQLVKRFDLLVLWRLARVVGRVACHVGSVKACPPEWAARYPLLCLLFDVLCNTGRPGKSTAQRPIHIAASARVGLPEAFVWWDLDGARVVAVFPGCRLTQGATMAWSVSGAQAPPLQTWVGPDGLRVEETCTEPLDPAGAYIVRVRLRMPDVQPVEQERTYRLPVGFSPFVLFAPDGRLVDAAGYSDPLPPGDDYLALVPERHLDDVRSLVGVEVLDEVTFAPIGWQGWRGLQLRLSPDAVVDPYEVVGAGPAPGWALERPQDSPVEFDNVLPVWLSGWPRVRLTRPEAFAGATVEVENPASRNRILLRVGAELTVGEDNVGAFLDLTDALADLHGTIRLTCRLPAEPLVSLPALQLLRLDHAQFSYVQDPEAPDFSTALRVLGPRELRGGTDTLVNLTEEGWLVRALRPEVAPGVVCILPEEQVEIRVRLPVTRLCHLRAGLAHGSWVRPSLQMRLADVGLDDRLRLQLHLPPDLRDGQLLCRLVGGGEVKAGRVASASGVFDIPLHRWRDAFGPTAAGRVQVRAGQCWIDAVELSGTGVNRGGGSVDPVPEHIARLFAAAFGDDQAEALDCAKECLALAGGPRVLATTKEQSRAASAAALLHLGRVEEAQQALGDLLDRPDLYEVTLLAGTARLRCGLPQRQLEVEREVVRRMSVNCPQRWRLLAEFAYRQACFPGRAEATWEECIRMAEHVPAPMRLADATESRPEWLDWKEAMLLRALALFMLLREVTIPADVPHTGQFSWLDCFAFASRYLRTVWRSVDLATEVPEPGAPAPAFLRREEEGLVRLVLAQARGDRQTAASLLGELHHEQDRLPYFGASELLQARQLRLEERLDEARAQYDRLIGAVREGKSPVPRELLLREYPAARPAPGAAAAVRSERRA